jgi:hypothetical protein
MNPIKSILRQLVIHNDHVTIRWARDRLVMWQINARLADIASIEEFSYRPKDRSLRIVFLLAGESEPVHLEIVRYTVVPGEEDGTVTVRVEAVRASRPWIDELLRRFLEGAEAILDREVEIKGVKIDLVDLLG